MLYVDPGSESMKGTSTNGEAATETKPIKISIVTIVWNSEKVIRHAVESVLSQKYENIEYIVVDGQSTDSTLSILEEYKERITTLVSEPDTGIYNALNKGISLTTGDVIGILHADDEFADENVITRVAEALQNSANQVAYGDLEYVSKESGEVIRYWESKEYKHGKFNMGWMMPHPTLFVRRSVFETYGLYNEKMKIAADYEFMLRIIHVNQVPAAYVPHVLTKMRVGGASNRSMKNIMRKTFEDLWAWQINHLGSGRKRAIFMKNVTKVPQFFKKQFG